MKTKRNVPARAMQVYKACAHVSKQGRPYLYGGGHAKPLERIAVREGLDCSSSIALALHRVGMFPHEYAIVSGLFAREWGQPGRGKYFTVWANAGHVWVQFHGIGRWWRFDTSPWNSGGRGPRMRLLPRPTRGFTPRHWPGL